MLCVFIVEGMSVVVNVMLSLMSVINPPPALCNLSVRTVVKLCTLGAARMTVLLLWVRGRCSCGVCVYGWYTWFR